MRILIIVDKRGTAIDRLARGIKQYNYHLHIDILPVHPKRPSEQDLDVYKDLAKKADVIHFYYYRSGEMLRLRFPEVLKGKKTIVTHHNPYAVNETKAEDYDATVVVNKSMLKSRNYNAYYIPLGVDLRFWRFGEEFAQEESVIMVANRIEAKKGILPVAKACKNIGVKFILVGNISDPAYFEEVMKLGAVFYNDIPNEKLKELYQTSMLHICNSVDNFESGTLPILEAMACGCPVLTRAVGHVPDFYNGENVEIYAGDVENTSAIEEAIKSLLHNRSKLIKMREAGFETVKNWGVDRTAYRYAKLYYQTYSKDPLVSIIMPTYNRGEKIIKPLTSLITQTYKNIEILLIDDGSDKLNNATYNLIIKELQASCNIPIRYIYQARFGYGLARARNLGVLESMGEYLMFVDDRLSIDRNAVLHFVNSMESQANKKLFLWGVKDNSPKGFVENFSFCGRQDFIYSGMFSEQVNVYGGMTQELRTRLDYNGWKFMRVDEAKAYAVEKSSSKWLKKDSIIQAKMILFKLYGK